MFELLTKLCEGRANKKDLAELESLAQSTKSLSLCGLGKTAPNPLISTLQHFRDEYEAHLNKDCPAGVCPDLIAYEITEDCVGCTLCAEGCPVDAIAGQAYEDHVIDVDLCIRCDACRQVCPEDAVIVVSAKAKEKPKAKAAAKPAAAAAKSKPAAKKEAATAEKA
jgi:NADH-quinone oxidoreductase subunit F